MDMNLSNLPEIMKDRETCHAAVHGITESDIIERLNNNNCRRLLSICTGCGGNTEAGHLEIWWYLGKGSQNKMMMK